MEIGIYKCERRDLPVVARMYNELAMELKSIEEKKELVTKQEVATKQVTDRTMEVIIRNAITECGLLVYVAKQNEEIIGFISGSIKDNAMPLSNSNKIGYIEGAYVAEAFRRANVMTTLEEKFVQVLQESGVSYIELNVLQSNQVAKRIWEKQGYSTIREKMHKMI